MIKTGKQLLLSLLFVFLIFCGLVYYNYSLAQKAIRETRDAPLSITLVSAPERAKVATPGEFVWHVESSPDLSTTFTTIYWSYESSPSALTKLDTRAAVGYPYSQTDYASGRFSLPDTFAARLTFDKPGPVWFRAYARINDENLWSEEYTLLVDK